MRLFLFLTFQAFYTFGSLAFGTCVQLHHLLARGDSVAGGHTRLLIPNAFYLCSVGAYILRFSVFSKRRRQKRRNALHRDRFNRVLSVLKLSRSLSTIGNSEKYLNVDSHGVRNRMRNHLFLCSISGERRCSSSSSRNRCSSSHTTRHTRHRCQRYPQRSAAPRCITFCSSPAPCAVENRRAHGAFFMGYISCVYNREILTYSG